MRPGNPGGIMIPSYDPSDLVMVLLMYVDDLTRNLIFAVILHWLGCPGGVSTHLKYGYERPEYLGDVSLTVPPLHLVDWKVLVGFLAGSDERFDGLYEEFYPHQTILSGFRQELVRTVGCCGHRDQLLQLL